LKEKEVEAYASSVNSLREVELKKKRRDKIAESARTATRRSRRVATGGDDEGRRLLTRETERGTSEDWVRVKRWT